MNLDNIGFYTLSEDRAKTISHTSPLMRCELIITDRCNFKCPYCRGVASHLRGDMRLSQIFLTIDSWAKNELVNIRFSGGEPTLHPYLVDIVDYAKAKGVYRIALSTNGSADIEYYKNLIDCGVNDFSISLDACCASFGEVMNGGIKGTWLKAVENIKELSKHTYVTVGMVFNEKNVTQALEAIHFADSLGVADIRVISSAQYNRAMGFLTKLPKDILEKYPILKYRVNRAAQGRQVRGLQHGDCNKCFLVLDDVATIKRYNYPCIIYMREGGEPISKGSKWLRESRLQWHKKHNPFEDDICKGNCLDVCIDFNNKCMKAAQDDQREDK
jgi:MoaA/NifB/PqqE/SkfB family radical SAM enzyme